MTVPPIKVDIVAGQNTAIPEIKRTGDALHAIAVGAGSGLSPVQKFSKALVMAEGHEGTLALRAVRGEMISLAEQAAGASNPLVRLGATMLEFGVGGATGLAAVGGFAAIAFEVKYLTGLSDELEKTLRKANTQFAQMAGGAASLRGRAVEISDQREALRQPGFWTRLLGQIPGAQGFANLTGVSATNTQAILSQEATLTNERHRTDQEISKEQDREREARQQKERDFQHTLVESALAVRRLELGLHPTNAALAELEHESRADAIALSNLKPEQKARLLLLEGERARIERTNAVMKDIEEHGGLLADPRRLLATPTSPDLKGVQGQPSAAKDESAPFGKTFGVPKFAPRETFLQEIIKDTPKVQQKPDVAAISASAVAVLGALQAGGAGGILTSGGGLLEAISKGKGALGTAGLVTTALGGVMNIFNNNEERRHKELLRQLKRIEQAAVAGPQRVTPILVGASRTNAAEVAYEVGRYQDRDGVPRGVGGIDG